MERAEEKPWKLSPRNVYVPLWVLPREFAWMSTANFKACLPSVPVSPPVQDAVCVCDLATRVAEVSGQSGGGGITCAKLTLPEVSLEGSG